MANKQEPQSVFGCMKAVAFGYLIIIMIVILIGRGDPPDHAPRTISRVIVIAYTVFVFILLGNTEFKKTDDWFK